MKDRDEPTEECRRRDPPRGDRDEWTIGVNNSHRTLGTMGACGRQHKGVVSLVLAGATPGRVVRRQAGETPPFHWPADHEALGHTSEAAAAARLIRIEDVRSGTAEQEDGAIHRSTSSAREKPTKVNVDDEGRSGVAWERKAAQKRSACATRFV